MAETHELRLKINAAAARAGARDFVAAISSIKRAVRELDRDSAGTFGRLKRGLAGIASSSKVKLNIVDRTALRNLESYSRLTTQAVRATGSTSRSAANLSARIQALATSYGTARAQADALTSSVTRLNTALGRQAAVAGRAAAAGGAAGAGAGTSGMSGASRSGAGEAVADQARIQRAVETTRLSVERLTTQFMKIGGFQSIADLGRAFSNFQREVSSGTQSAATFTRAQNGMRSAIVSSQTALTTLTAKTRDEARAQRDATNASRDRARAALASAAAMRTAEQATAGLSQRLKSVGDARGLQAVQQAMMQLRNSMSSGSASTQQISAAMSKFNDTLSRTKVNLIALEGAQSRVGKSARTLATQENQAAAAARTLERDMRSAAGAANAAQSAFRGATGGIRGMENAFSGGFQAASLFRTALGSLTLGTFTKSVFQAGDALQQFNITMEVASGSMEAAAGDLAFINEMSSRLGTSLNASRDAYSKFAVSAQIAGVATDGTRQIFESVSTAMAVLGRGADDQRLAFLALEQMMSKGVISAEELRRQLGERLPGAVNLMAKAVGVSTSELQKMLKAGELISSEVLPKFARELDKTFGAQLPRTFNRAGSNLGRLTNEFTLLLEVIANTGFLDTLSESFRDLTSLMRSGDVREAAANIGRGLADAAQMGGDAIQYLITNIETVGTVVKNVIGAVILAQFFKMGQAILLSGQQMLIAKASMDALAISSTRAAQKINLVGTAAGTAAVQQAKLASATTLVATAGGKAGIKMGAFARVFGLLGGPIGIAISALTLVPLLLGSVSDSAEEASAEYEDAMRRMGVSTFYLIDRAKELQSLNPFEALSANLPSLREAQKEVENFRSGGAGDGLGASLAAQFENINTIVPSASAKVKELRDTLDSLRNTDSLEENVKQVAAVKDQIVALIAATYQTSGAFEAFRELEDNILPGLRAIMLQNELMGANTDIAGDNARAIEALGVVQNDLNNQIIASAEAMGSVIGNLSNSVSGFGGTLNSVELRRFSTELRIIGNTFDGSVQSIDAARAKVEEVKAAFEALAKEKGVPQFIIDSFYDAVTAAEADITALETLQTESAQTAAEQARLAAQVNATGTSLNGATTAAWGYAGALREIQGLAATGAGIITDASVARSREIEIATAKAAGNVEEAAILQDRYNGHTSRTLSDLQEQLVLAKDIADTENSRQISMGSQDGAAAAARRDTTAAVAVIEQQIADTIEAGTASTKELVALRAKAAALKKSSSGGGATTKAELTDLQELRLEMEKYLVTQREEILANSLIADGRVQSAEAAQFMAQALIASNGVIDETTSGLLRQAEAAGILKEKYEELSNDGVNAWVNSVPSWRKAGQQIETEVIGSLGDALSTFIQTGKFSFEELGASILASVADIVADKAMKEVITLLGGNTTGEGEGGFGLGGMLSDLFGGGGANGGSMGDTPDPFAGGNAVEAQAMQQAMITGGQQAAEFIRQALTTGGATAQGQLTAGGVQAGTQISTSVTTAGTGAGTAMNTAITTGGTIAAGQMGAAVQSGSILGGGFLGEGVVTGSQTGGGFFSQLFSGLFGGGGGGGGGIGGLLAGIIPSLFGSGGGVTGGGGPAIPSVMAPATAFRQAPHFAMGTPNVTGGVPAILHDNEAVVPLTGGRKIPIEGGGGGGGSTSLVQHFNITTPDADSFRKSQSQIAADAAGAGQRAFTKNR